jgi:hypothetical protein
MTWCILKVLPHRFGRIALVCAALVLSACSLKAAKGPAGAAPAVGPGPGKTQTEGQVIKHSTDVEIEDLRRIPQQLGGLAAAAGDRLTIAQACRDQLRDEFESRFFAPWSVSAPAFDAAEARSFMKEQGQVAWYGPNKRKVAPGQLQELLDNCALEGFPSRNDTAIAVAPSHLRGLPTYLPHYRHAEDYPFDMFSYPHVKLNEPLRVLHASRDGVWLFVETGYTNGWIAARDVALVDRNFIESWRQAPHLVVTRDYAPVPDGLGVGVFRAKVGTILPLERLAEGGWEVLVASAGEGGRAQTRAVSIPHGAGAPFPLEFSQENLAQIGGQFLGEPYGWGEIYDLRDCSAMLRDFFLPFGIWLPRTSADQVSSVPGRVELAAMSPSEKTEAIRSLGIPFLSLLYKPGHIMLYVGVEPEGRPLLFHDAWSIRLKDPGAGEGEGTGEAAGGRQGERTQIIGVSAITTLEPGKELSLVPGGSLLERVTELATITNRCQTLPRLGPVQPPSSGSVPPEK